MSNLTIAEQVTALVDLGRSDATLIEWGTEAGAPAAISESVAQFLALGWRWTGRELLRDGWGAWFRSQGALAPPIVQWRMEL